MTNAIVFKEIAFNLFGVDGRMRNRVQDSVTGLYRNQVFIASRPFERKGYRKGSTISIEVRFDDQCNNGQMSFSMTGEVWQPGARDSDMAGCIHDELSRSFPELKHLIKWHLFDTRGPMQYIANTVYHASNRDHNGLLKGEEKQIINGKTCKPSWKLAYVDEAGNEVGKPEQYADGDTPPVVNVRLAYVPWTRTGEGKERNFAAARSCAAWPEATDEELSQDKSALVAMLEARAPALVAAFRADVTACGFAWAVKEEA